ncbi:MAG: alpha/beta hydrolase [Candidatus Omnitrophota bacterium]
MTPWWQILLVFSLLLVLAYAVYGTVRYTRMISGIFLSLVYKPPLEPTLSSVGEKITILDSADREIEALVVESGGARKIVIFCHESGCFKESWEKYAYFLPAMGYHVVSFDFGEVSEEGQANSLSQWPTEEDVQKLLKVIHWARKAFRQDIEVVLFGVSNGADIAFAASFLDPDVKAVIADGLFSMKEIFRDYIRKWAPMLVKPNLFGENYPAWVVNSFTNLSFWYSQKLSKKRFVDIEKLLKKSHKPLIVIHGEADDYIPERHQRLLEKLNRGRPMLKHLVVPKAKHNQAVQVQRELYEKSIVDFLDRA